MTYLPQLINWLLNSSPSSSFSSSEFYDSENEPNQSINDNVNDVDSCDHQLTEIDSTALADPPSSSTSSKRRRSVDDESFKRSVSQKTVWTKEDELELLRGFLDYTRKRNELLINGRKKQRDHIITFYNDHVTPELKLRFNETQTVEKLRRLKRKYLNSFAKTGHLLVADFGFRSAHERAIFAISHEIWRPVERRRFGGGLCVLEKRSTRSQVARAELKRSTDHSGVFENIDNNNGGFEEQHMRELVMALGLNYPVMLMRLCDDKDCGDEIEGKEQEIVEFEVYLKKLEFVQLKVKAALAKLRSKLESDVK